MKPVDVIEPQETDNQDFNQTEHEEMQIIFMTRITVKAKKKLKRDAKNLGIPMNRYFELLIEGKIKNIPDQNEPEPEPPNTNKHGVIELPGGGTFTPAEGYEHLRIATTPKRHRKQNKKNTGNDIIRLGRGLMETPDGKLVKAGKRYKD